MRLIIATRQPMDAVQRPLSFLELKFFFSKFFKSQNAVSSDEFSPFWEWLGPCLQKVRYTKNLSSFWNAGLLIAFISKQDLEMMLSSQPPGTFMLRFSERNSGTLSIGYKSNDPLNPVKHCLLTEENAGKSLSRVADFIGENMGLTHFLKLVPRMHTADQSNAPNFVLAPKDEHLREYYTKQTKTNPALEGYETRIDNGIQMQQLQNFAYFPKNSPIGNFDFNNVV